MKKSEMVTLDKIQLICEDCGEDLGTVGWEERSPSKIIVYVPSCPTCKKEAYTDGEISHEVSVY